VVDVVSPSPEPARLLRRQLDGLLQFPTSPLIHTAYAVTWFGLSLCIVVGTALRFRGAVRPADSTAAALNRNLQTMRER
jgi:cytochrome oxidase assembly protein ShyY1